jgi:hypothetical protein
MTVTTKAAGPDFKKGIFFAARAMSAVDKIEAAGGQDSELRIGAIFMQDAAYWEELVKGSSAEVQSLQAWVSICWHAGCTACGCSD